MSKVKIAAAAITVGCGALAYYLTNKPTVNADAVVLDIEEESSEDDAEYVDGEYARAVVNEMDVMMAEVEKTPGLPLLAKCGIRLARIMAIPLKYC